MNVEYKAKCFLATNRMLHAIYDGVDENETRVVIGKRYGMNIGIDQNETRGYMCDRRVQS